MTDVVGRGIVEVVADATNLQSGMAQATAAVDKFEQGATDSARKVGEAFKKTGTDTTAATDKLDGVTRRFIASLEREALQVGKTRAEYLELRAAKLGVTSTAAPFIAQLREAEKNVAGVGLSAKQTAAALRGVPAQLTDIVTSLQGGQQPLTVFLQQGGQLRDMFGGAAPAARALGSAVLSLVNPFTVAAAAAAALGIAYFQGSKEADAYARAIILTGNAAGSTVGEMQAMAAAVAANVGTQAQAAEAIAGLAQSGQVASASLDDFAETAVRLERTTGKAIADTVKEFAELGKAPVEASRRLNEQYNYLTFAVFEQIKALEEQGRVQEAAAVAQEAYATAFNRRADQLTERLGYIERGWLAIKDAAAETWDAMRGIGRPDTPEERLGALQQDLRDRLARGPLNDNPNVVASFEKGNQSLRDQIDLLQTGIRESRRFAQSEAERDAVTKAATDAEKEIDRIRQSSLTKQEKLSAELAKYRQNIEAIRRANPNSNLLDPDRIARDEANIRERFRDRTRPRAVTDDAATRMLQQLREAEAATRAQLETTEKLTGAQKQIAEFEQLIADLKEKRVLTADQKSLLAAQDNIRAQLAKNAAVEAEVAAREKATKEQERQKKLQDEIAGRIEAARVANEGRREGFELQLSGFTESDAAREQLRERLRIQREFQRQEQQLVKRTPAADQDTDFFRGQLDALRSLRDEAIRDSEDYYRRERELQSDWSNGAIRALKNYADASSRVADQTEGIFTRAFQGMEDALVQFVQTGKLDFKSLADSIIADIIRMQVRAAIAGSAGSGGFLGAILSAFGQSGFDGGSAGSATGGSTGGDGAFLATGTNYVPYDGFRAVLHKGEAVVPAKYNPAAGGEMEGARGGDVIVNVKTEGGQEAKVDRRREGSTEIIDIIVQRAVSEVDRRIAQGGSTGKVIGNTFNVNRGAGTPRRN